jgi:hypothetical protein
MAREMTIRDLKEKVQARMAADLAERMADLQKYAEQVELFEEVTGLEMVSSQLDLRYGNALRITRDQLPAIRKAVGRLEVSGKSIAGDFDRTNEVQVSVRPKAEKFNKLEFTYRSKFRNGGKCKVVEQQGSSYKTLVCSV